MSDIFRCLECGRVYDNGDICPECGCPASYTQNETLLDDLAAYVDEARELEAADELDDEEDEVVEEDLEDVEDPEDLNDPYEEMLIYELEKRDGKILG